jgi:hypothetical protein
MGIPTAILGGKLPLCSVVGSTRLRRYRLSEGKQANVDVDQQGYEANVIWAVA